jgi:hypothetical protein
LIKPFRRGFSEVSSADFARKSKFWKGFSKKEILGGRGVFDREKEKNFSEGESRAVNDSARASLRRFGSGLDVWFFVSVIQALSSRAP